MGETTPFAGSTAVNLTQGESMAGWWTVSTSACSFSSDSAGCFAPSWHSGVETVGCSSSSLPS